VIRFSCFRPCARVRAWLWKSTGRFLVIRFSCFRPCARVRAWLWKSTGRLPYGSLCVICCTAYTSTNKPGSEPFTDCESDCSCFEPISFISQRPIALESMKTLQDGDFRELFFVKNWVNWHLNNFGQYNVTRSTLWHYWDLWKIPNANFLVFLKRKYRAMPKIRLKSHCSSFGGLWRTVMFCCNTLL